MMTIVLFLLAAVLAGTSWYFLKDTDRGRPEISFTNEAITYQEGDDVSALLVNVTAYDEHDGDLTSEIRVNQITPIDDGTRARVTYVVIDAQKNIATATQIVDYIPLPDESADESLTEEGALTDSISLSEEAEAELFAQAEAVNPEAPVLVLTADTDTIGVRDIFNYRSYIDSITDDKDSEETLYRNIVIEGDYSTERPGNYPLTFYVNDSDGNVSNIVTFILYRD